MKKILLLLLAPAMLAACTSTEVYSDQAESDSLVVSPKIISEPVLYDTDDPAIWINEEDPANSLILGTDKHEDGALYVFDLKGRVLEDKVVRGLNRPNNVDVEEFEYGDNEEIDIAVVTERLTNKIRIFRLPDMKPMDNGGIEVFEGETERDPMGVALYKRESDDALFVILSRKNGPEEGYLWQYRLTMGENEIIQAKKVREFGKFSGQKEIEAIAVDDEAGYVYYSDEGVGVRKYHADPDLGNEELALFATEGFARDHEGISIYKTDVGEGYIIVSDQDAQLFRIYNRFGSEENPHDHRELKVVNTQALNSDGSEVANAALGELFPRGLFVAMSDDRTFQFYDWADIAGDDLMIAPNGMPERSADAIKPVVISEEVEFDTDDPAIWINEQNPSESLIIGTDKEVGGGIYAFDLDGKVQKSITGMDRPNNVDVAYGLQIGGEKVDVAVVTERKAHQLRVFSLPDLEPIDGGGLPMFFNETNPEYREVMGISMYTDQMTNDIYAIVGRKDGPSDNYLEQHLLSDDGNGGVKATLVRTFGKYSGVKEIEAIAVDNELGYVYYSDEIFGIRKYYAHPDSGNTELAVFGNDDFVRDMEGISIYKADNSTGYIIVSNQQINHFNIYPREGSPENPHEHKLIDSLELFTRGSDGNEVTSRVLSEKFPHGLFVAMSDEKTFHYYSWSDLAGNNLFHAPNGKILSDNK